MNDRARQLEKAYNWLDKAGDVIGVIIPAHADVLTGERKPSEYVNVYKDEIDIYRQIYGNRLIEIVE